MIEEQGDVVHAITVDITGSKNLRAFGDGEGVVVVGSLGENLLGIATHLDSYIGNGPTWSDGHKVAIAITIKVSDRDQGSLVDGGQPIEHEAVAAGKAAELQIANRLQIGMAPSEISAAIGTRTQWDIVQAITIRVTFTK